MDRESLPVNQQFDDLTEEEQKVADQQHEKILRKLQSECPVKT